MHDCNPLSNMVFTHRCCGSSTAHEVAHMRADERLNRRRWPWERIVNGEFDDDVDIDEEIQPIAAKEQQDKHMYV